MADIPCPVCGKLNPETCETCQFCQAPLELQLQPASNPAPDWLDNLRSTPDGPVETATAVEDEAVPEWLAHIRSRTQEDRETAELSSITLPDWLSGPDLGDTVGENTPGNGSGWLDGLRGDGAAEAKTEMPDWLQKAAIPIEPAAPQPAEPTSTGEEPGEPWLALQQGDEGETVSPAPRSQVFSAPLEPGSQPPSTAAVPDWLKDLAPAPRPAPASPPDPTPNQLEIQAPLPEQPAPEPAEDLPTWLRDFRQKATAVPSPIPPAPAPADADEPALPDWLGKPTPPVAAKPEPAPQPAVPAEPGEAGLSPAEMPNWVRAMRPIETVAPAPKPESETVQRVEDRGPLAGLRGILPIEPGVVEMARPSAFTPRLQATDRQRAHQALLETLLSSEAEPRSAPKPEMPAASLVLRLVVAAVLLLAVLVPVVTGQTFLPLPTTYPGQVYAAQDILDALPQNAPVLVAVDYTPNLAGELEAASAGIVNRLMAHGARLALISTSPTGSALAARLLEKAAGDPAGSAGQPYLSGDRAVNLGYLAGGTAGLVSLVESPQTAAPYTIAGQYAWSLPTLQGIHALSDFSMLLILADNPDTGRAWVEQVRPALGGQPVLVVSSAQAAPMLLPYYDSGQVQGLVSGISGGALFEQAAGQPGLGSAYWGAYQTAAAAAVVLILLGAITDAALMAFRTYKAKKTEA